MATRSRRERCTRHTQVQSGQCSSCGPVTTMVRRAHTTREHPAVAPKPLLAMPSVHGRRRAVLCGVSYKGKEDMLEGTVNDVNCMKHFLIDKIGFPSDSVLVLTEEETNPNRIPTKRNILKALRWLIEGCQAGDSLVFHFSGHGARHIDMDMDEIDGYDESISPVDHDTEGDIRDDEINNIMVRPLPRGATLHALFDACHSGTSLDLPYFCRINREGFYKWEDQRVPKAAQKGTNGGLAICFGACEDHRATEETDAFSTDTKEKTGALTYSFIQSMQGDGQVAPTYGNLLSAMRSSVREAQKKGSTLPFGIRGPLASLVNRVRSHRLSTKPQLSSSERFEIYSTRVVI